MAAAVSLMFAPVTPALVQFVPEPASTDTRTRDGRCCFYFWGGRSRVYSHGQSSLARPQGQDTGWGYSEALTSPFQLCPIPELCRGAASVHTPSLPAPRGAARLGRGSECAGHWGLTRDTSPSLYIFSSLIARAECTRLCCRMLPLGSWQRLILKCQLLSRGTGSNELPQFALVPGTGAPSPTSSQTAG